MIDLQLRSTTAADIDALIELQALVYPSITPWRREQLQRQLETFPQGQFVAVHEGQVVGCTSSLVILWDEWAEEHSWKEITAAGTFATHNPAGLTLYGAEVFVHPRVRGLGVGHAMYEERRQLCKRMNLRRIIACGRLPGYHKVANDMPVELYAKKVVWGDIVDPVLSFQLREGFRYCGIMNNYLAQDRDSCGHAALIVWINPDYHKNTHPPAQPSGSGK